MTGRLILVIGGAASGKSQRALELAGSPKRRAFVATAQALDVEMADRIRRHRGGRSGAWTTAEVPLGLASWFEKEGSNYQSIVLDCLTLWLSNLRQAGVPESRVPDLTAEILGRIRDSNARVVIVTNELGMGLVPMDAAARRFRDLAGAVNRQVALAADEVHLVVSGLNIRLK